MSENSTVIESEPLAQESAPASVNPLETLKSKEKIKERTYCRSFKYWRFNQSLKAWVEIGRPILEMVLKDDEKLSPYAQDDEFLSPLESEVKRITMDNQVVYAGPLAGYSMGEKSFDGQKALVTEDMDLLTPKQGDWSTLAAVFDGALISTDKEAQPNAEGERPMFDQRALLYGWWQHAIRCLYYGPHSAGCALFLCGERKGGKTLTGELIRETLGRRFALPYAYMTGKDNFNEEMFESVVQWIDDENADTRLEARLKFGAAIKQMVAAGGARMRGMHTKAKALRPLWRMIVCLNMEPDRLMVIPPLDDDVEDKMLILKIEKKEMPMPAKSPDERAAFWKQLTSELPAFVWWLLNEFELPENLRDRFGVRHWCHPSVKRELTDISPEQQLLEFIERLFNKTPGIDFEGSCSDLRQALLNNAGLSSQEQNEVPKAVWIGRRLSKLEIQFPDNYSHKRTSKGPRWEISSIND